MVVLVSSICTTTTTLSSAPAKLPPYHYYHNNHTITTPTIPVLSSPPQQPPIPPLSIPPSQPIPPPLPHSHVHHRSRLTGGHTWAKVKQDQYHCGTAPAVAWELLFYYVTHPDARDFSGSFAGFVGFSLLFFFARFRASENDISIYFILGNFFFFCVCVYMCPKP